MNVRKNRNVKIIIEYSEDFNADERIKVQEKKDKDLDFITQNPKEGKYSETNYKWEDCLDFELEISSGSRRKYPVAIIRSPACEAHKDMQIPFDDAVLENLLKDLQIALLRSSWVLELLQPLIVEPPLRIFRTIASLGRDYPFDHILRGPLELERIKAIGTAGKNRPHGFKVQKDDVFMTSSAASRNISVIQRGLRARRQRNGLRQYAR